MDTVINIVAVVIGISFMLGIKLLIKESMKMIFFPRSEVDHETDAHIQETMDKMDEYDRKQREANADKEREERVKNSL